MGLAVKKVLYRRQMIADFEDSWPQSQILLSRAADLWIFPVVAATGYISADAQRCVPFCRANGGLGLYLSKRKGLSENPFHHLSGSVDCYNYKN
jgi:hypothetical protein